MTNRPVLVGLFSFCLCLVFAASAQRNVIDKTATKIFDERLNKSYKTGQDGFMRYVGLNFNYPVEARTKGVMGLSVFAFKVGCDVKPYGLQFKTKLDFGIEQEIER